MTSEKGLEHRSKRPVEPEAVFGQIKFDKQYNRFRHRGIGKINMDFGILAIAFNIAKMFNIKAKSGSLNDSDILNAGFVIYFFITTQIIPEKSISEFYLSCLNLLLKNEKEADLTFGTASTGETVSLRRSVSLSYTVR